MNGWPLAQVQALMPEEYAELIDVMNESVKE